MILVSSVLIAMLQELDVQSNKLTGSFPATLLDLMDLCELRLSNNSFRCTQLELSSSFMIIAIIVSLA